MISKRFLTLVLLYASTTTSAQFYNTDLLKKKESDNRDTVAWIRGGNLNVGFNQGFLHNWPAGGELTSLTVNGLFSGYAVRMYHKHIWSNYLDMNYSLFYANSNNFVPRKLDDRIDLSSKYSYRVSNKSDFFMAAMLNFKSQFTKAYNYDLPSWDTIATSEFLSPAYITIAPGFEYRRGGNFQVFLSPIASRITLADREFTLRSQDGAFGVKYGESARYEFGAFFSGRYQVDITKSITYKTRLDMYVNYLAKDVKDSTGVVVKKDNPGNVDVMWDNQLSAKIAKHFNVLLGVNMLYDNDIPYQPTYIDETGVVVDKNEPGRGLGWVQMKQIFTFGIVYKF